MKKKCDIFHFWVLIDMGWEVFLPERFIEPVENKIHEIAGSVEACVPNDGGLMGGAAGLSCFCAYYAGHTGKQRFELLAADMLEQALRPAAGSFPGYSFADGLSGTAWMIHHLKQTQLPWLEASGVFEHLDRAVYEAMMNEMRARNFDYLHAALGMAMYFIRDTENPVYRQYISDVVKELFQKAEIMADGSMKWISVLDAKEKKSGYNLSLSHGLASILIILSRIRNAGIEKDLCELMIRGGLEYMRQQEFEPGEHISLYPSWAKESSEVLRHSRMAWCYGDIGIGLSYFEAGRRDKDENYFQGMKILEHTAGRRDPVENLVLDAGLCHGAAGLAMIYNHIYQNTKKELFKDAALHWLDICLQMDVHEGGPAGYKAHYPKEFGGPQNVYGFLEGVAGIGLVLLSFVCHDEARWMQSMLLF